MSDVYYLLEFDQNWADEHDVPAVDCFSQEEYDRWLAFDFRTDNPKYDEQYLVWKEAHDKYTSYLKGLNDRGLMSTPRNKFTIEDDIWARENEAPYVSSYNTPSPGRSKLNAYLGNSGDGFEKSFTHCKYGRDFITYDIVSVTEVDASFYEIFHKAQLASLSLCNIFDMDAIEDDDEYYDDELEED